MEITYYATKPRCRELSITYAHNIRVWEVLPHPSNSPDLAHSDYHLFGFVKDQPRGQRYETTETIQKAVRHCLRMAGTEFYRRGIFKLPERWEKCVQRGGDYVEKYRKVCRLRRCIWFVNNKACYFTKKLLLMTFGTTHVYSWTLIYPRILPESGKCVIPVVFVKIGKGMQSNTTVSIKVYLMAIPDNYMFRLLLAIFRFS